MKADKRFGQHFLAHSAISQRIADAAMLSDEDTVLEIGPGLGILTKELLERADNVTSVEIDRRLIGPLQERFSGNPHFRLVEGDILATDFSTLFPDPEKRIVVCANIPYNITAPIIEYLCMNHRHIDRAILMVQREVADRLLASPGNRSYGLPTINLALCAEGRKIMKVAPGSFKPPPAVHSTVIALTFTKELRYPLQDEVLFRNLTGAAFRQRRKMIRNTLGPFMQSIGIDKEQTEQLLESAGIALTVRPETVSPEQFVALSNALSSVRSGT